MISAEVSLYPMEKVNSDEVIKDSLKALTANGLSLQVGPLSTRVSGPDDAIWTGLRALFDRAQAHGGEIAMVVTVANSRE
ncbi:MAG TPA: hypothetical protein GX506_00465 [Firmicutes bacterium]|nr:hypothetical protein [Bacillota bacterium]